MLNFHRVDQSEAWVQKGFIGLWADSQTSADKKPPVQPVKPVIKTEQGEVVFHRFSQKFPLF